MRFGVALTCCVVLAIAGCSSATEAGETSTSMPADGALNGDPAPVEAAFDGKTCTVAEPTQIASGDYAFIMTSSTPDPVDIEVQIVPNGVSWNDYVLESAADGFQPVYPMVSFTPLPDDLPESARAKRYVVEPGEYAIYAIRVEPPTGLWACGPLSVTE